jgi:DNA-binding GntR family transcriptional regulator
VVNCRDDDHERILRAMKARDGQAAADLMAEHLRVIESTLDLRSKNRGSVDLVSLFSKQ